MPPDTAPILTDTGRLHLEQEPRIAAAAVRHAHDAFVILDGNGHIVSVNPAFTRLTGSTEGNALRQPLGAFVALSDNPSSAVADTEAFVQGVLSTLPGGTGWESEVLVRRTGTPGVAALLSVNGFTDASGRVSNFICVLTDLSAQKALEEELRQAALHDPLTGLPNRNLFMERGNRALLLSERHDQGVSVVFIDLDHFKPVNDIYGRDTGDFLLMQVAERLVGCVRASDTVARLGGDEFVILLPEVSDTDKLIIVAEKILAALNEPFQIDDLDLEISCSIGIARHPVDGADMPSLLRAADECLYRVKQSGRNTYNFSSVDPD